MLKLLSLPLTLLATILLARGLGPEGFGHYAFIIALLTTLSIPAGPALMQLTTRETARLKHDGEADRIGPLLRWSHRNVLIASALGVAVIGGFALWQAQWRVDDRWSLLLLGLLVMPLLGLNAVRSGILAGLRRVVMGQFPDLFVRPFVLLSAVGVLLLVGSLNPATAVAAFISGAGVAFLVGVILLRRAFQHEAVALRKPAHTREENRQWMRAWMPFTLLVAASTLNAQIGILLLGWMSTADQVAAMQVAERGAMLVTLSLAVVNLVIGPHITQVHRSGDRARLQALSRYSARLALLVALPIALPLLLAGGPILGLVFGEQYRDLATWPLVVLVLGQLANVTFGSVGMLLTMSGFEGDTLRGQTFALLINLALAALLIPFLGAVGAAIGAAVGLMVWNVVLAFMVVNRLDIRPGAFWITLSSRDNLNAPK
ncbi:O-antigen/teichoic acid export membrane protein [Halomonas ventosae]|uniref:O-antigen/teichoic acid export membrane protein n=2 Tax=Halomonas ventosae TaxID=229007 RepID=A0A2T0VB53_9GAMM|nr:O-antigen/teichoic acid export membrane protein [Halomonas ventosae]